VVSAQAYSLPIAPLLAPCFAWTVRWPARENSWLGRLLQSSPFWHSQSTNTPRLAVLVASSSWQFSVQHTDRQPAQCASAGSLFCLDGALPGQGKQLAWQVVAELTLLAQTANKHTQIGSVSGKQQLAVQWSAHRHTACPLRLCWLPVLLGRCAVRPGRTAGLAGCCRAPPFDTNNRQTYTQIGSVSGKQQLAVQWSANQVTRIPIWQWQPATSS